MIYSQNLLFKACGHMSMHRDTGASVGQGGNVEKGTCTDCDMMTSEC